jgi:hypothetical protein
MAIVPVAQRIERLPSKQRVAGSNPARDATGSVCGISRIPHQLEISPIIFPKLASALMIAYNGGNDEARASFSLPSLHAYAAMELK